MTVKTKNIFKRLVAALLPFVLLSMYSVSCFAATSVVDTEVSELAASASGIGDTTVNIKSGLTVAKLYLAAKSNSSSEIPKAPLVDKINWVTAESIGATISDTTLTLPKSYIESLYSKYASATSPVNVFIYGYYNTATAGECILALRFNAIPKFTAAKNLTWYNGNEDTLTIGTLANATVSNLTETKLYSGDNQVKKDNKGKTLSTTYLNTKLALNTADGSLTFSKDVLDVLDYGTYKLTFKLNGGECSVSFTVTDDQTELEAVVKEGDNETTVATLTFLGAISDKEPKIAVRKIEPAYPAVIWSYDLKLKDKNGTILDLNNIPGDKTLKLIVGAKYAGKKVMVYHNEKQLESTETDKKYFTVGQAGGIDIKVASLSPFTVVLADGQTAGDSTQTGDQGNNQNNNAGGQGSNNGTQTGTGTNNGTNTNTNTNTNKGNAGSLKTGDAFYGLFSLVNTIASAFGFELIRRKKFNG